jgi:histidyl-tRNA synthetase
VKVEAPRGTLDVLPADQPAREAVIRAAESAARDYGYRRIVTPTFEDTSLFARTSGAGSDVVQKEMYTFEDRAGRSLTLRPEATAPIARAYLEHGLHREPQPVKTYLIGPMFRYSAPQKGRYREFWQLDFEAMGSDDPAVDAELVQLFVEIARRADVRYTRLEVNSIGDRACRPSYVERLRAHLADHAEELDEDARAKAETSPLRVFDSKTPRVQRALETAPTIGDSLCEACRAHFDAVRRYLDAYGIEYDVVPTLVRGLDYYTRTVWEFVNDELGAAQATICAGGRYDYLVEEIGGPPVPGVGWAAGVERMVLSREAPPDAPGIDVFVAVERDQGKERVLPLLAGLRSAGIASETDYAGRSLKGQRTHAGRLNARYTVIYKGSDEPAEIWERGGAHEELPFEAVQPYLLGKLA